MKQFNLKLLLLLSLIVLTFAIYDIRQFGAVPNTDTLTAQFKNKQAIQNAFKAANKSETERIVKIPPNMTFYSMPSRIQNIKNLKFLVQGKLVASKNVLSWPTQPGSYYYEDFIHIINGQNLTITGGGKIDGRGYHWWIICILDIKRLLPDQNSRPHLIHLQRINKFSMHDLILKNSAQFHVKADDVHNSQYYNIDIKVNTTAQFNLFKKFSFVGIIPLFPLNTDGIDPSGANMTFYNITCQNFDDVVVPKPANRHSWMSDCTQNIQVQNCTVKFGVGMTIGSVPPNSGTNCVRNVTFKHIKMHRPIKAIYVKSNPGDVGDGIIQNIWYENFTMDRTIWWTIYIGPQQMKQPDGDGPGCMLYPLYPCQTQPRITMRNITLKDISVHNSFLFPIILRCNTSNPCHDFTFINVKINKWRIGEKKTGVICEYVSGRSENCSPKIDCLNQSKQLNENVNNEQPKISNSNLRLQKIQSLQEQQLLSIQSFMMIMQELQKGVKQIGYQQQDDDFDYEINDHTYEKYKEIQEQQQQKLQ